jgi:hypothetical protein
MPSLERSSEVNDILRWAKEADLWMTSEERIAAVERFAALVRADEKEQCARSVEVFDKKFNTGGCIAYAVRTRK